MVFSCKENKISSYNFNIMLTKHYVKYQGLTLCIKCNIMIAPCMQRLKKIMVITQPLIPDELITSPYA